MQISLPVLVVLLAFCLAGAVNIPAVKSANRGAPYKAVGYEINDELKTKVAQFIDGDTEECEFQSGTSTNLTINCPSECRGLGTFAEDEAQCASNSQFGCSRVPCDLPGSSDVGFSCELNRTLLEKGLICQGSDILINELDIKRFQEITFNFDISAPPVQTDLYFLADTTGSMNQAISTAIRRSRDMVRVFGDRENVAIGVGNYQDERDLDGGFEHQFSISEDTRGARTAIRRWRTGDGQDVEEANLVALYKIATEDYIGWRQGSRKFVVYFGDAPGHEPTCDEDGTAITRELVIEAMKAKNITVVAVNFGNLDDPVRSWPIAGCGGATGAPAGQATEITEATGGAVVSSTDQTQLVSLIESALRLVKRTYTVEHTCGNNITTTHNPALPLVLEPLEKAQVKNTIRINDFVCDNPDFGFSCEFTYEESGANIEGGVGLSFLEVSGC